MKRKMISLALILTFMLSLCSFKVAAATKTYKVNNTVLEFAEIFYVDSVNGSDDNDGLTPQTAFQTIRQYARQTIENSACILSDGIHYVTGNDFDNNTDYTRTYIGTGLNTRCVTTVNNVNLMFATKTKYTNFIRLCFDTGLDVEYMLSNGAGSRSSYLDFKNVAFFNASRNISAAYMRYHSGFEDPVNKYISYSNCAMQSGSVTTTGFHSLKMDPGFGIEMENCIVPTNNDIGTWVAVNQTNLVSAIDEKGQPMISNTQWENSGTGLNPDGTQSHIGVYGGEFAWDWDSDDEAKLSVLLEVGEEVQLSVSDILGDNIYYTWTSTDNDVAAVDINGKVTAIKAGEAIIYVEDAETGFSDYINITVVATGEAKYERLAVDLNAGQSAKLHLSSASNIVWTSFEDSVVTVDNTGKITGVSPGLAIVQAQHDDIVPIIYVRVR